MNSIVNLLLKNKVLRITRERVPSVRDEFVPLWDATLDSLAAHAAEISAGIPIEELQERQTNTGVELVVKVKNEDFVFATYNECLGVWVLGNVFGVDISPTLFPVIQGTNTISFEQYLYMVIYVLYVRYRDQHELYSLLFSHIKFKQQDSAEKQFEECFLLLDKLPFSARDILNKHWIPVDYDNLRVQDITIEDGMALIKKDYLLRRFFGCPAKRIPELEGHIELLTPDD